VHESIILLFPSPTCPPTRLQYYCNTFAQCLNPFRPPVFTPYTLQYCAWQYRVEAKANSAERDTPVSLGGVPLLQCVIGIVFVLGAGGGGGWGEGWAFTRYCHYQYCIACTAIKDGWEEALYCAGVPRQRKCLRIIILILVQRPRALNEYLVKANRSVNLHTHGHVVAKKTKVVGCRRRSAANKNRVLRKEYRREDQYLCIEIQP